MPRRMRWLAVTFVLLSAGCDQLDAALPVLSRATPVARLSEPARLPKRDLGHANGQAEDGERKELEEAWRTLRERLSFSGLVEGARLPPCSEVTLERAPEPQLSVGFVDARAQTRSLIPRRIAERLESPEIAQVREASDALESRSSEPLEPLSAAVRELQKRRWVGVFYVTDYSGPALILRVGELRRSWYAGSLAATFALFDTEAQKPVCGHLIRVQNDVKEAPIRSRLQSETRGKLERDLADAALAAAGEHVRNSWPQMTLSRRFTEGSK